MAYHIEVETRSLLEAHHSSPPIAFAGAQLPWCLGIWAFNRWARSTKLISMSFFRRGDSSATADLEIRKYLEVSFSCTYNIFRLKMHILSKYFLSMQVKRYLKKSDKDRNGSLTKEEWYNVLNSSGVPTTE